MAEGQPSQTSIEEFIRRWESSGAAERANYQLFLCDLCDQLGVPRPEPSKADPSQNLYVFEHPVLFDDGLGHQTTKFIDLYKRECFVLEAKQGSDKEASTDASGLKIPKKGRKGTAVRGTQGWDDAMLAAKGQAELYARALPIDEGWPPFLVIVDVGHSIELYADFSRTGKTYVAFPDARSHRIPLRDLAKDEVRERLRLVWTDPIALDPSRRSAKVTREVAVKLAEVAKSLERSGHPADAVANFLMRCLFTMFAEDVGLLPKESFTRLLEGRRGKLDTFCGMISSLWRAMDKGEFSPILERKLMRFNGQLFASAEALPVTEAQLELLIEASKSDWSAVEPAIFGTLLERALDPVERHKLGAHYTPRAYVERLVLPTIVEPLREEWEAVQAAAVTLAKADKLEEAREEVGGFLDRLCKVTVLDPACGSGNFLYVTLEHLKRLEGEVRDALRGFGERQEVFEGIGLTVDPHQLLGIEVNPRAAAIAELVLWIGYLQWHFRTFGAQMPAEPIIKAFHNIECRDAVLEFDRVEPVVDETGQPVSRWDGRTTKKHPVTGEDVPDGTATVPVYRYVNPRKAEWPKADYIIGNPPFVGNKRMRQVLGDGYVEALRSLWTELDDTIDYVMYWWAQAAEVVRLRKAVRFGLITTNSITQAFNRGVIQTSLERGLSLVFAIPDHPWVDSADGAAVRVAMTVGQFGDQLGTLTIVIQETLGGADEIETVFRQSKGPIHANLRIGAAVTRAARLAANKGLCQQGVKLVGDGFLLTPDDLSNFEDSGEVIRPFLSNKDLVQSSRGLFVIDFDGYDEDRARDFHPSAYQRLYDRVRPYRMQNRDPQRKRRWWLFGRSNERMRASLRGLSRFIVTPEVAKHRPFVFVTGTTIPDASLYVIGSDDSFILGVLSSRAHVVWALATGGKLGVGNDPRYQNGPCFEPYPFPNPTNAQRSRIGLLAERLDRHRRDRQFLHPDLSITKMYNIVEKLRSNSPLSDKEKGQHEQGLISVLKQIHDELDAAVFEAYGWPIDLSDEEILERLVALNAERAAEEARGIVRWLRPDFQKPEAKTTATQESLGMETAEEETVPAAKPKAKTAWPKTLAEQAQAVRTALVFRRSPAAAEELAKTFHRARVERIHELLETLTSLGQARMLDDGRFVAPLSARDGRPGERARATAS